MDLMPHLDRFARRFAELEEELARPDLYDNSQRAQELTREHSRLKQLLADGQNWLKLQKDLSEAESMAKNTSEPEMAEMAVEELATLRPAYEKAEQTIRFGIVPPDENDSRNTIVEIRAGVGGDEAALFAAELARMYTRYAERVGWKTETLDLSPSDKGGVKEIIFQINGTDVFKKLRYESGVHRVQRVPATEAQGRVHTSTATVAVLPEAKEVDLVIKLEDLDISVCRSGGSRRTGGQHHRLRRADHSPADGCHRPLPGRTFAAQEQGQGDEYFTLPPAGKESGGRGSEVCRASQKPDRQR